MLRWVLITALGALSADGLSSSVLDHARTATRRIAKSVIRWEIKPGEVLVYLDGKKLGHARDLTATPTAPGRHVIRLVKGDDETEMEIEIEKGQILRFVLDFSE